MIDADPLYERAAELEAQALAEVGQIDPAPDLEEWEKWNYILNERTAFKHDVADAPTVDAAVVVRCKDCEYGEQDEVGRWFCRSLGCQIGSEDGSGYCADAERRTDG